MHVEEYGRGKRVFLAFHGWGGDHREFAPVAARRPPDARVLSVDLPGYGKSPKPASWDLAELVAEVAALLEERDLRDVTLAGYCSGAVIALLAAERDASRLRRLVLIDPFAYVPWYFRIFLAGEFGRRAYRASFASPAGRRITNWVLRRRQDRNADFMGAFGRVDHEVTLRYMELFGRVGPIARFGRLHLPIDLVCGGRTFGAVRDSVRLYAALWPHARLHRLPGEGHLMMVRGAAAVAGILFGA